MKYSILTTPNASNVRKSSSSTRYILKLRVLFMPMHWHPHQRKRRIMKRILNIQMVIISNRHLLCNSAGRHNINILETSIQALILHFSTYLACIKHHSGKLLNGWCCVEKLIGCRARQDDPKTHVSTNCGSTLTVMCSSLENTCSLTSLCHVICFHRIRSSSWFSSIHATKRSDSDLDHKLC